MEPEAGNDETRPDPLKFESMTVNPGFVPEGLAFWHRWCHPKPEPA